MAVYWNKNAFERFSRIKRTHTSHVSVIIENADMCQEVCHKPQRVLSSLSLSLSTFKIRPVWVPGFHLLRAALQSSEDHLKRRPLDCLRRRHKGMGGMKGNRGADEGRSVEMRWRKSCKEICPGDLCEFIKLEVFMGTWDSCAKETLTSNLNIIIRSLKLHTCYKH